MIEPIFVLSFGVACEFHCYSDHLRLSSNEMPVRAVVFVSINRSLCFLHERQLLFLLRVVQIVLLGHSIRERRYMTKRFFHEFCRGYVLISEQRAASKTWSRLCHLSLSLLGVY